MVKENVIEWLNQMSEFCKASTLCKEVMLGDFYEGRIFVCGISRIAKVLGKGFFSMTRNDEKGYFELAIPWNGVTFYGLLIDQYAEALEVSELYELCEEE